MKFFPKSPVDWSKALFRVGLYCVVIDVAVEHFFWYHYDVKGFYHELRQWQLASRTIGLCLGGFILLWSCLLLRGPIACRSVRYALAGIPFSVLLLLWFYFCGGASVNVKS